MVSTLLVYAPDTFALDKVAASLGGSLRQVLYGAGGQKEKFTYVNYAFGNEAVENWYGYEQWRLDRLRALKQKYDPLGRFSFTLPSCNCFDMGIADSSRWASFELRILLITVTIYVY